MTTHVLAPPVVATSPLRPSAPGDRFAAPLHAIGDNTSVAVKFKHLGYEAEEEDLEGGGKGTIWIDWVPATTGDAQLDAAGAIIEVYQGATLGQLTYQGGAADSLALAVSGGGVYKVRLRPATTAADTTLYLYVEPRENPIILMVEDLLQAPGNLLLTITNGDPGARVTLTVTGHPALDHLVDLDAAGTALNYSMPIDEALAAGVYILNASHPGRSSASTPFDVLQAPEAAPSPLPPPEPATTVPGSVVLVNGHYVRRFVLQDKLAGGLGEYILPRNPTSMSSPFPDNVLSTETSLAPNGQILTWEGARRSKAWHWSGYLDTEAQLNAMLNFCALQRRFYVIDHRNRAWQVSMEAFAPEPVRNVDAPWAHSYKATFLVHDGPVQL